MTKNIDQNTMQASDDYNANAHKKSDVYANSVISSIDRDVFKTLNLYQLEAIYAAISRYQSRQNKKHHIDVRGVIPLYFIRLYFVFILGRDRRAKVRALEQQRNEKASLCFTMLLAYGILCMSICTLLGLAYLVKAASGLDFFPDWHFIDIFSAS